MKAENVQTLDKSLDAFFKLPPEDCVDDSNPYLYGQLGLAALQTSYLDYQTILNELEPHETLVDLGAGYGRGTFLAHAQNRKCISIELSSQRYEIARSRGVELGIDPRLFICADLSSHPLPMAEAYYLYFPNNSVLLEILSKLYLLNPRRAIRLFVTESHGDLLPTIEMFKGVFKLVKTFPTSLPRHHSQIHCFQVINQQPLTNIVEKILCPKIRSGLIKYSYFHPGLKHDVSWYIRIDKIALGFGHFIYEPTNRWLEMDQVSYCYDPAIISSLENSEPSTRLLEFRGKFYWEDKNAQLFRCHFGP